MKYNLLSNDILVVSWLAKWISFDVRYTVQAAHYGFFDVCTKHRLEFNTFSDNLMLNGQPITRQITKAVEVL